MDSYPLKDEHLQCCNRVLDRHQTMDGLLKKCRDCGLDVSDFERVAQEQYDMARKLKQHFFPRAT